MSIISSSVAPPNIALIKYWGKRDNMLKLPLNDSLSMTLDANTLASRTTILISSKLLADVIVLNGKKVEDAHIAEALKLIRARLGPRYPAVLAPILIISSNNFPTSAGIASSASGFAALAQAVAGAVGIVDKREISILARLGSGSASRSIFGGFAKWNAGKQADGEDCFAEQIAPSSHWPGLADVIAVTDAGKKKVSSKMGMERTVDTSELFECRLKHLPARLERTEIAIVSRDFAALGPEIMKDSNSMHATMLETWPPVIYLNDVSRAIVEAVHAYNTNAGEIRVAYTFDAGPNAHLITTRLEVAKVKSMLKKIKGVQKIFVSPIGEGAQSVAPDRKLVEKTLKQLKLKVKLD